MTANTSVHLTLKEFTWTAAKSCDKILIQNLYLSCRVQHNHDILKYIFTNYGQI